MIDKNTLAGPYETSEIRDSNIHFRYPAHTAQEYLLQKRKAGITVALTTSGYD